MYEEQSAKDSRTLFREKISGRLLCRDQESGRQGSLLWDFLVTCEKVQYTYSPKWICDNMVWQSGHNLEEFQFPIPDYHMINQLIEEEEDKGLEDVRA